MKAKITTFGHTSREVLLLSSVQTATFHTNIHSTFSLSGEVFFIALNLMTGIGLFAFNFLARYIGVKRLINASTITMRGEASTKGMLR